MSKKVVSVSIEEKTSEKILKLSKAEKRSFSQMVDILLQMALDRMKCER